MGSRARTCSMIHEALLADAGSKRGESGPLEAVHLSRHKWPTLTLATW